MATPPDGLPYPPSDASPDADARQDAREALIYNATEDLLVCLDRLGVTRAELARRLGRQPSYVSRALSGAQNMTLATFSDFCHALGFVAEVRVGGADAVLAPERRDDIARNDAECDDAAEDDWVPLARARTAPVSFRVVDETVIECDVPQWHADAA